MERPATRDNSRLMVVATSEGGAIQDSTGGLIALNEETYRTRPRLRRLTSCPITLDCSIAASLRP